jgi:PKD repeat protein
MVALTIRDGDNAIGFTTRQVSPVGGAGPLAFVAAASANGNKTTHTVTVPASVQSGDELLLYFTGNVSTATITGPPGWTSVQTATPDGIATRLWQKVASGSDVGSTISVMASAYVKADLTVAAYRGAGAPPVETSAVKTDLTTTSAHTTPTVTVADTGDWLVSYWAGKSSSATAWSLPAGQTVRSTSTGSGGGNITAMLTDTNGAVATGTRGGLTATSNAADSRTAMFTVAINASSGGAPNQPPTAAFSVSCVDLECAVDGSASNDPDGTIASYSWTFGDGETGTGESTSHTYAAAGDFTVTLTVTDGPGATGSATHVAHPTSTSNTISFVGAASVNGNNTAFTLHVPASVQPGDGLLLFFAGASNTTTITGPAGWTAVQSLSPDGVAGRLWSRVATAADAGASLTVKSSAILKADLTVAAYRGTSTAPVAASAVRADTATLSSHVTPTVSVGSAGGWLVSYWATKSTTTSALTTPAGQAVRGGSTGTGGGHMASALTDGNGPVPTGTQGGLTATSNGPDSRAVMFSVVLALSG